MPTVPDEVGGRPAFLSTATPDADLHEADVPASIPTVIDLGLEAALVPHDGGQQTCGSYSGVPSLVKRCGVGNYPHDVLSDLVVAVEFRRYRGGRVGEHEGDEPVCDGFHRGVSF